MALADGAGGFGDPLLTTLVFGSVVVTLPLVILSVLAYHRRRTRAYLFVATAFTLFFAKSVIGAASLFSLLDFRAERLLEYGLDIGIAVCILAAVALAKRANQRSVFSFEDE